MLKTCNFCTCLTDSLLRDRIVLGTKDDHTRKRLLQERSLNLKKCIDICKSGEMAMAHLGAMGTKTEEVHRVNKASFSPRPRHNNRSNSGHTPTRSQNNSSMPRCKFCLKRHVLKKESCPAWGRNCNVCGKKNHWKGSEVCERKAIHTVAKDSFIVYWRHTG